jgi:hypothetical protein
MSVESDTLEKEPIGEERRQPDGRRIPYEGLVEVGGAVGPSFEAQAVDVSRSGMHLRTAYLPKIGQPLTCRFDAGTGEVLASGEVVWRNEEGPGGDFAIRFAPLDAESSAALGQIVDPGQPELKEPGARVRLHIDGLNAPMRARVKGARASELTVGSDLGFLQVGKRLDLEDTNNGAKRPARIDRVEIEIDKASQIPQLVVTLRYDDEAGHASSSIAPDPARLLGGASRADGKLDGTPEPSVIDEEADGTGVPAAQDANSIDPLHAGMKGAFARGAARVGPTVIKLLHRARTTVALLAARTKAAAIENPLPRRTTSPPPGGGLHTSGRRVVRSEPAVAVSAPAPGTFHGVRRVALVATVLSAALVAFLVLHRPSSPVASAPAVDASAHQASVPPSLPSSTASAAIPEVTTGSAVGTPPPATPASESSTPSMTTDYSERAHRKPGRVAPFGSGLVTHGNVLRIKMDGVIEKIEGASSPMGFTVVVPNRRSLEAAAPLAARDSRIGSIRVSNETHGAELTVSFKDGVPNYQVRAKGDTLELVLATAGRVVEGESSRELAKPVAKKPHRLPQDNN